MGFLFTLLLGVALGYFFKPQIDTMMRRVVRMLENNRRDDDIWRR
ncbi:MAG: hypothetical protein ACLFUM_07125 [Spirochaetaceae bacterium]